MVDHCGDFKSIWGKSISLGYDLSFILWMISIDVVLSFVKKQANLLLTYESIEKGYVGAFCSQFDYLYANGENSHINALHKNCGNNADYIAVNTFPDRYGRYVAWQEDCLWEDELKIYLPSTCSDPLACLVYLNWISNSGNIGKLQGQIGRAHV